MFGIRGKLAGVLGYNRDREGVHGGLKQTLKSPNCPKKMRNISMINNYCFTRILAGKKLHTLYVRDWSKNVGGVVRSKEGVGHQFLSPW